MPVSTADSLDLSAPVAALLRLSTAEAHDTASQSKGAGWLTRGELDREEYVRFCMMLYHIYDTFERALEQHASHPVLQPTYNPILLARASSLAADIAHLLQVPDAQWQAHPIYVDLMSSPPKELTDYTSRIQSLASGSADDIPRLLAHSYVRYLGDLSGGQFVKRQLSKVYDLDDGLGVSFYEFRQLGGTGSATIGDMKKIKEWFREGMNAGVGDDVAVKQAIIDEAAIAYNLNSGLFAILREPSGSASSSPSLPPLGQPSTPPESEKILQQHQDPPSTSNYGLATVIAVVAAISLSHFFLTVGGFTGASGAAKLEAVQHWFANVLGLFSSTA